MPQVSMTTLYVVVLVALGVGMLFGVFIMCLVRMGAESDAAGEEATRRYLETH